MEFRRAMTPAAQPDAAAGQGQWTGGGASGQHFRIGRRRQGYVAQTASHGLDLSPSAGTVRPGAAGDDTLNGKRIAVRLQEELQTVRAKHGGTFDTSVHNYPEHVQSSHELEDIVKSMLPAGKEEYAAAPRAGACEGVAVMTRRKLPAAEAGTLRAAKPRERVALDFFAAENSR